MRPSADILILSPARTAELFTGYQHRSACNIQIVSDAVDRQSRIHLEPHRLSLHCRIGDISCQLIILAIAEVLRDQHHHPMPQILPVVRELVLIGQGKLLLEQALVLAGHGRKITLLRSKPTDACRRAVGHYLGRYRQAC